jgi:hypothetical protein
MATIKLCYGIKEQASLLAAALGVQYGDYLNQKCDFCATSFITKVNFCSNCGHDMRADVTQVSTKDIVELAMLRAGAPPRSVSLFCFGEEVCICQVLAEGQLEAVFPRSVETHRWKDVANALSNYAGKIGLTNVTPYLFAIEQKED